MSGTRVSGSILLVLACASCGPHPPFTVSQEGFGPVTLGMSLVEAERLLGVRLEKDNYNDHEGCRYYTSVEGYRGLAFMTSLGKVVRVDVDESEDPKKPVPIATEEGAKIGDTEARVLALYKGRIKVSPHFYGGLPSHYFRVYDGIGKVRLIFETDGKAVTSYRAGREPEIEYVEGCQ